MIVKGITDEDFINYKLPSMFIATAKCSFKCDKEYGSAICQNGALSQQPNIEISTYDIVERYLSNPITHAVVLGGLEPFDQLNDVLDLLDYLRTNPAYRWDRHYIPEPRDHAKANDPFVIYTGYTKEEVCDKFITVAGFTLNEFANMMYGNVFIKFGRYIPGQKPHLDPVLGVYLASDNQYAERIS